MRRKDWVAILLVAASLVACGAPTPDRPRPVVLLLAAASLQTVIDELTPQLQADVGVAVRTSYASSAALARQIESGAPADLFISADLGWMDYLESRHAIRPDTRVDLLSNELALIAPASRPVELNIAPDFAIAQAVGSGRLAIAEPESVPAGRYARAALTSLGVWESVADRLAPAEHVRAALLLVSRGETPLGIVYRTDAAADRSVAIVDVFPPDTHPPILYPAALTTVASDQAALVLGWLQGEEARAAFVRHGFLVPESRSGRSGSRPLDP